MNAILFDLDGTLIDSQDDIVRAFGEAFRGLGLPLPPRHDLLSVIGMRLEDCFARFLDGDAERSAEGARIFRAWYHDHYLDATRPYPQADAVLRDLRLRHPIGVCTMKRAEYARRVVAAFGWEDVVEALVGSEEGFPAKPDPAMLVELCRRIGVPPSGCLYVGDTLLDARMAQAAAAPFAFAAYGYGSLEGTEGLPPRIRLERVTDLLAFA